jgi:hypothetical protein
LGKTGRQMQGMETRKCPTPNPQCPMTNDQ